MPTIGPAFMTTYVAAASSTSTLGLLAVNANGTKITRVDMANAGAVNTASISVYTGASFSGGTAVTPFPMRSGAPAASATSKAGATVSGTQKLLALVPMGSGSTGSYQPAYDLILAPGAAIWMVAGALSGAVIYFEELRLAWSL